MRSVIIYLLPLLFVPAFGAPAHMPSLNPSSIRLPSVHQLATHEPLIHLAPIKTLSTPPHQLPIHQPPIHQPPVRQPPTRRPPTRRPPRRQRPVNPRPIRPSPVPAPANPPPPHGQIVAFHGNTGRRAGVILGSQPDQQSKFKIAPVNILRQNPAEGPVFAAPYNQVVKAHPDDLVSTNLMAPNAASHIMGYHAQHQPVETDTIAPIYGSRNYAALHGSRLS